MVFPFYIKMKNGELDMSELIGNVVVSQFIILCLVDYSYF